MLVWDLWFTITTLVQGVRWILTWLPGIIHICIYYYINRARLTACELGGRIFKRNITTLKNTATPLLEELHKFMGGFLRDYGIHT